MEEYQIEDIAPFSDEEAAAALAKIADHPYVPWISKYIFSNRPETHLRDILKSIHTVDEFQSAVMSVAIEWVIQSSVRNFSYDGLSHIEQLGDRKFLAMSNHRDIILDPAFTQIILFRNKLPLTEICVGDNLLRQKPVEYLIRSNRMIKVIRGVSARELYFSSQVLSKYIRDSVTTGRSSVWIAQKQGRTKDGKDLTEQGLLKMLDMSGEGDFVQNFMELNLIPLSISYEYEPCDILKARELLISRTQKYVKTENEDLQSILFGIKEFKGNVHLNFGEMLSEEEIRNAARADKNDRYQAIRHAVDRRVIEGYRLWKTNYMAADMMAHSYRYSDHYTPEDLEQFTSYIENRLNAVEPELNRSELRDILLHIYGNPVIMKETL